MTTLKQAIAEYIIIKQANGRSQQTVKWYQSILGMLGERLGERSLQDISAGHMTEYILQLRKRGERYTDAPQRPSTAGGLSAYSIQSHIRALKAFWGWAADEYQIGRNPMRNIENPRLPPPPPKAIKPRDVVRLLDACGEDNQGHRNRAIILFLADTGARVGGLCSLTIDNLDLNRRCALLTEKGGDKRRVFFTHYTGLIIARWLRARCSDSGFVFTSVTTGAGLSESGVYQMLKRLGARARVKTYNPHSFRDGFAIAWVKAGGDISTLARLLGHKDIKTTADYYALFADDELQAIKSEVNPLAFVLETAKNS